MDGCKNARKWGYVNAMDKCVQCLRRQKKNEVLEDSEIFSNKFVLRDTSGLLNICVALTKIAEDREGHWKSIIIGRLVLGLF